MSAEHGRTSFSRRRLFAGTGALGTGFLGASLFDSAGADAASGGAPSASVAFRGVHQAGITTPPQAHLVFCAYDVTAADRRTLGSLLGIWTAAAERLSEGHPLTDAQVPTVRASVQPPVTPDEHAPPSTLETSVAQAPPTDTGEALGLSPASLTVTVGFGPGLFDDRFGLSARRPSVLAELPALPGDALDPTRSGGDLCLQICADDAQVAFHAAHNLTRLADGAASLRYYQLGFASTASAAGTPRPTPRNLMGFHDGTANAAVLEPAALNRFVWVRGGDQEWMHGGTYLVARRVRVAMEAWARSSLAVQEGAVGRMRDSGAPLGGKGQYDPVRLDALSPDGQSLIPPHAHIRLAAAATNGGKQLLRRSYNFADGLDPVTGELEAGVYFLCYQRDPIDQFVAVQRRLAASDTLTLTYLEHTSSAVFACPPGVGTGESWGRALGLS